MHKTNYEGKACDAVVKAIERRTGLIHTQVRRPEVDRVGPPVDLRFQLDNQEYAMEHTPVEPFEDRIKMEGARTVLVLESMDYALTHFDFRSDLLPDVLDEIFLVQTNSDHWRVVPLKYSDGHWPDTGMPQLGVSYYDPRNSSFPKWLNSQPRHIRESLQLDQIQTPFEAGFVMESFKEEELNDLTQA